MELVDSRFNPAEKLYMEQLFPLFDILTGTRTGEYLPRNVVHREGLVHKGVQAHICRPMINTDGSLISNFEVLIQKRKNQTVFNKGLTTPVLIDLGGAKWDQSLATQMVQRDISIAETLKRGLENEWGLTEESYEYAYVPLGHLIAIKTYSQEQEQHAYNKELISLFLIQLKNGVTLQPSSSKIDAYEWIPWDNLAERLENDPDKFTKTAQFYMNTPKLLYAIDFHTKSFLGINNTFSRLGDINEAQILTTINSSYCVRADIGEYPPLTVTFPASEALLYKDVLYEDYRNKKPEETTIARLCLLNEQENLMQHFGEQITFETNMSETKISYIQSGSKKEIAITIYPGNNPG